MFDELTDESEILKYKLYQNYKSKSDINFNKPIIFEGKLKMNNKKTGKMVVKHFQLCDKKLISYKISVKFCDFSWFFTIFIKKSKEPSPYRDSARFLQFIELLLVLLQ